jgi:excisionase family DNA binding protein
LVEDLVEDFGRPLLTVAEAARRLNVSPSAIRTLCRRGLLPSGRVLNFIRLRPQDVERFVVGGRPK